MLTLGTNIPALGVRRELEATEKEILPTMERLASGKRIVQMKDDAAGVAISHQLEGQYRSVDQARRNALDALSVVQTAGSATNEVSNLLQRLRELAIQAGNDSADEREREFLGIEADAIREEMGRIAESTTFLGTPLLSGEGRMWQFQVSPNQGDDSTIVFDASALDLRPETLGISGVDLSDPDSAQDALSSIDSAWEQLGLTWAQISATQSRLEAASNVLAVQSEALHEAHSRVADADIAAEATRALQLQVKLRAGAAVLAQANQLPAIVLRLLE